MLIAVSDILLTNIWQIRSLLLRETYMLVISMLVIRFDVVICMHGRLSAQTVEIFCSPICTVHFSSLSLQVNLANKSDESGNS